MNNSENTDQIMRYDTGEMDEAERLAFEARLAKDAELQADYAAYQALAGFLHQLSEGRMLRAQWEDMRAHVHEEASQKRQKARNPGHCHHQSRAEGGSSPSTSVGSWPSPLRLRSCCAPCGGGRGRMPIGN
jgi:anti-sigma factor RsiW